ncbi:hypothetical protein I8751_11470 [Nostocaceae cyanobacterium CENA357]|uniref:GAF domain-containing protein n=1 Tax=Atlanticothrix silvestris CENA357 TaxID=1725252 RepID=A0A8J7HH62_9CYAN|nr:hypothetical protein [Atlanticothrix silvestris]MBH8552975.1 hypothetical protein [Atlanticothrix silvestris CENA357]
MALNLPIIPNWAKLASFLGTLLIIVINGIVGNRADEFFLQVLLPYLKQTIRLELWWAVLGLLIGVCPLLIILRYYYKAHQIAIKLNKLDESLLLLLPELSANPDINEALKRLFEDFISRTLDVLQLLDGCGIAVYAPDPNDSDFLNTWCQLESPNENKEKARFYIGSDTSRKRGVAGNTFLDKNRRVVHLTRKNGAWQADSHEYVFLVDSRSRRRLSYRTLITIPISGDANDNLGVLCLYSNNITAFDSIAVQDLLVAIAGRLSAAMLLARTYRAQPMTTI